MYSHQYLQPPGQNSKNLPTSVMLRKNKIGREKKMSSFRDLKKNLVSFQLVFNEEDIANMRDELKYSYD